MHAALSALSTWLRAAVMHMLTVVHTRKQKLTLSPPALLFCRGSSQKRSDGVQPDADSTRNHLVRARVCASVRAALLSVFTSRHEQKSNLTVCTCVASRPFALSWNLPAAFPPLPLSDCIVPVNFDHRLLTVHAGPWPMWTRTAGCRAMSSSWPCTWWTWRKQAGRCLSRCPRTSSLHR